MPVIVLRLTPTTTTSEMVTASVTDLVMGEDMAAMVMGTVMASVTDMVVRTVMASVTDMGMVIGMVMAVVSEADISMVI